MTGRRPILTLMLAAGFALGVAGPGHAQTYPNRPIKLIVPFPPGGPTDVTARLLGHAFQSTLGQNVVVESRPGGAGGTIGAKAVASADPDGYTLLISQVGALTISPSLYKNLEYDVLKNFTPVALVVESPQILTISATLPVKTFGELIAYAKANPGKINFASPGAGTQPHLLGELLKLTAGITLTHVPYRGSAPAITDLLTGQVQVMFDSPSVMLQHIEAGKLRALAVTSAKRDPHLPNVPTVAELGYPRLAATLWTGMLAPAGTPTAIVDKVNTAIDVGLKAPDIKASLDKLGVVTHHMTPTEFGAFMAAEVKKWAQVVKDAGIQPQ
jgi:tripartite-type tricarboxylate transporter receptor subunit TctC